MAPFLPEGCDPAVSPSPGGLLSSHRGTAQTGGELLRTCHFSAVLPPFPGLPFGATDHVDPSPAPRDSSSEQKHGHKTCVWGGLPPLRWTIPRPPRPSVPPPHPGGSGGPRPSPITPGQSEGSRSGQQQPLPRAQHQRRMALSTREHTAGS